MAGILWAAWLALSIWGLIRLWRMASNVRAESTPLLEVPPASRGEPSEAHVRFPLRAGEPSEGQFPPRAGEPSEASVQFPPRAGEPSEASVQFPPRAGEPSEASVRFPPRAGELSACPARFPLPAGGTLRRGFSIFRVRLGWLNDWRGWILALSVASFAPALAPEASLPVQAALTVLASVGLLRLMHALDSRVVGQGVVAGLGLIALVLDSLSGGAWARHGALGHGTEAHGVGLLYGTLALLWGLTVVRAWLRIEGNPLGAALGLGALACWLGWKGLTPALGWGAAVCALTLGGALLHRELTERRRVRLMLQNRLVRIVRRASNADLALTGGALVGLCLLALWLSGMPVPETPRLGAHAGWQIGILIVAVLFATPSLRFPLQAGGTMPSRSGDPPAEQAQRRFPPLRGGNLKEGGKFLPAPALLALLGGEPLAVAALASLWFWANNPVGLQEYPPHAPNPTVRTGGNE